MHAPSTILFIIVVITLSIGLAPLTLDLPASAYLRASTYLIFSPTRHDTLAQSPGHFTYYIDEEKQWWRCIWKKEWGENRFGYHDGKPALMVEGEWSLGLQTMHGQPMPEGDYQVDLLLYGDGPLHGLTVFQEDPSGKRRVKARRSATGVSLEVNTAHGSSILISADKGMFIRGIKLTKLP